MSKIYILDTNVLLHDPKSVFQFGDNDVVIPLCVIEELDDQKKRQDSVGQNARVCSRYIEKIMNGDDNNISDGIPMGVGGTIKVEKNYNRVDDIPDGLDKNKVDNMILAVTKHYSQNQFKPVILVTKDINLRIKSETLSICSEDYKSDAIAIDEVYTGCREVDIRFDGVIDKLYQKGFLDCDDTDQIHGLEGILQNEFINLNNLINGSSALCKYEGDDITVLNSNNSTPWGVRHKNREQRYAIELLMDDNIKLVSLIGKAGTGKTFLALAAGLQKVVGDENYDKLMISRPIVPMGNEIGHLPGNEKEKLDPWMRPIKDNMDYLFKESKSSLEYLDNKIDIQALTYIRGRSIPNQFMIVDEAQNLTKHQIKTLVTRVGKGTKIVLTGDPYQIDHPYLDANTNGLTYVAERLKDSNITGTVTLIKGERSDIADLASERL